MPTIKLSNGEIDYYELDDHTDPWKSSSCDIVVFQPGIIRHTEFVYHIVPLLSRNVRFIRRDLRGHCRSSPGVGGYTMETLVDEMADFIDKVAGRPVHWIGESTAGMVSIALAAKHPSKLKSLTLMSSPVALNETFHQIVSEPYSTQGEAMRKMGLVAWQKSRPVSKLSTEPERNSNEMGRFAGEEYLRWYDEMLRRHDVEGVARYCDFIRDVDVTALLEEIKVPTLVVSPTRSMASPLEVNRMIASKISKSRLVTIDSVGHMVYIDRPEETCSAILKRADW